MSAAARRSSRRRRGALPPRQARGGLRMRPAVLNGWPARLSPLPTPIPAAGSRPSQLYQYPTSRPGAPLSRLIPCSTNLAPSLSSGRWDLSCQHPLSHGVHARSSASFSSSCALRPPVQ